MGIIRDFVPDLEEGDLVRFNGKVYLFIDGTLVVLTPEEVSHLSNVSMVDRCSVFVAYRMHNGAVLPSY
jgi:hypothetical protein